MYMFYLHNNTVILFFLKKLMFSWKSLQFNNVQSIISAYQPVYHETVKRVKKTNKQTNKMQLWVKYSALKQLLVSRYLDKVDG